MTRKQTRVRRQRFRACRCAADINQRLRRSAYAQQLSYLERAEPENDEARKHTHAQTHTRTQTQEHAHVQCFEQVCQSL